MSWPSNYPDTPDDEPEKKIAKSSTQPGGILKDFAVGFKLAATNFLSYSLAMIGIIFVTVVLLLVILLFIVVPLIITVGIPALISLIIFFESTFSSTSQLTLVALIMVLILPILGPFFIALGSLFGMSREIVESDGTNAESAFGWYRRRALSLVGGGALHFLVTLAPFIVAFIGIAYPAWNPPTNAQLRIIIPVGLLWIFLINGMLSLTFPGIIDGLSAIRAAARSIRLTAQFPGRVLGAWMIMFLIVGIPILSLIGEFAFLFPPIIPIGLFEPYAGLFIIVLLFYLIPAFSIVLTRIYMILTAKVDATYTHDNSGDDTL
ncbi:MAG: hypothetical protein E3J86_00155 [Candidatus Thorarchaeota archaeon]|nr:MAG: hypothetical protein E3J86_00155 [Candidatus Thorarchaeota archaeon]